MAVSPTGEVKRSEKLILPPFMIEGILAALDRDGSDSVEIGVQIGTRPDEKCAKGYIYEVENLFAPTPSEDILLAKMKVMKLIA